MSATKIGENVTSILNWFSLRKYILWHIKLKIYMKKSNFTSYKQYLFGLLFSRNAKETHVDQSILQCFVLQGILQNIQLWKDRICKPSKEAAAKNLFFNLYVIGTTCFNECYFLQKCLVALKIF